MGGGNATQHAQSSSPCRSVSFPVMRREEKEERSRARRTTITQNHAPRGVRLVHQLRILLDELPQLLQVAVRRRLPDVVDDGRLSLGRHDRRRCTSPAAPSPLNFDTTAPDANASEKSAPKIDAHRGALETSDLHADPKARRREASESGRAACRRCRCLRIVAAADSSAREGDPTGQVRRRLRDSSGRAAEARQGRGNGSNGHRHTGTSILDPAFDPAVLPATGPDHSSHSWCMLALLSK